MKPRTAPAGSFLWHGDVLLLVPLLSSAVLIGLAWSVAAARLTIRPIPCVIGAAIATGIGLRVLLRDVVVRRSAAALAALAFLAGGLFVYLCWLAWPSLLPTHTPASRLGV